MNWIKKYGAVAVLVAMVFSTNPELRSLLGVIDALGIDFFIVLVGLQLQILLLTMPVRATQLRAVGCVIGYGVLRIWARVLLVLTPPGRATYGLSIMLVVATKILWCQRSRSIPSSP